MARLDYLSGKNFDVENKTATERITGYATFSNDNNRDRTFRHNKLKWTIHPPGKIHRHRNR